VSQEWTPELVKVHLEQRITDLAHRLDERYAIGVANYNANNARLSESSARTEASNAIRFASQNEFRAQLSDQAATFMRRNEFEVRSDALSDKIDQMDKRLTTTINTNTSRLDLLQGSQAGQAALQSRTMLALGALVALIGVVIAIITLVNS
jgi:hypothetical protein